MRRAQLKFGDHWVAEEVADLREDWMDHADRILDDDAIVTAVYEALGKATSQEPQPRAAWCAGGDGAATAGPQARPQLELRGARARGACQSRLPRLHSGRRRQDAGCQDHGAVGLGGGPKGDQAGPRADDDDRAGSRSCGRPADARGYHGGGDQYPLSNRLELAGRRCTGADPHHEEDHQDRWRDRYQTARPQSQREAATARYRAGRTLQGEAELRETQECLRAAAQFDQPRGRTSQAVLGGDRLWRVKRAAAPMALLKLQGLRHQIEQMVPLVKQVMKQTRARIYRGDTHFEGKLLSVFEPSTEVIRKGKAGKPNEFGKMVKLRRPRTRS